MNDEELNQFKELVVEYVKLDDIIRKKNDELKTFKKDKKDIEQYILESMEKDRRKCNRYFRWKIKIKFY